MESKKSQGPRRAVFVGGAAIACMLLGVVVYLSRGDAPSNAPRRSSPAASTIQPLFARCDEEPSVKIVEGFTRTVCTRREHPSYMIFQDALGNVIERTGLMVPMYGRPQQFAERKLVGLELFSLVAGTSAEEFLPSDQLADIGVRETRFARDGLVYVTQPMASVGLVFSVIPQTEDATGN